MTTACFREGKFSVHFRCNCKFPEDGKIFSKNIAELSFKHLPVTTLFFKIIEKGDNDAHENM